MRFSLTLFGIVVNSFIYAQFSDDFTDGDFTANPSWVGQTANFTVNNGELQLDAPAVSDTSYLSVAATAINNVTWDAYVRMEFNPSSSNLTRLYLVSDNSDLKASLNGYFVLIGGSSDEISLYRQDGTVITKIIDGADDAVDVALVQCRIRVSRDAAGNWELFRDTLGGYNFVSEGTVLDANHTSTSSFGLFCQYTSTRSDKFFFDELGNPYVDAISPYVDTATAISATEVDVYFSEPLDQATAETTSNYNINNGIGVPSSAVLDGTDPSLVHLTTATSFSNGTTYEVTVNGVEDVAGNVVTSPNTDTFFYFVPGIANEGDVIITEFLPDPTPPVGLPEVEYIELYNRSNKYFDLSGWTLSDAASSSTFGAYVFAPDSYVLICNNGDGGQFFIPNFTELPIPSLNNDSDAIVIKDDSGATIDSLYFDISWYNDPVKSEGGWSLEIKHLSAPCGDKTNWTASVDPIGGTPGIQNSVWTNQNDTSPPQIQSLDVLNNASVLLTLSESMDTTQLPTFNLSPSVSNMNWNWQNRQVLSGSLQTLSFNQIYDLTITNTADCWGNDIGQDVISFGLPDSAIAGDLILNEVMFNPLTGGSDYVEVYNHSDKILNLENMMFANWDDDSIANYSPIIASQYLLLPGEYALIAEDTAAVIADFAMVGADTFIQADLPTYPNDSGTVFLLSKDQVLLDQFHYDESYHFELLDTEDGKALERISFDSPTNDPDNWHTAAENVDWGTPGYQNSQAIIPAASGVVSIDPKIFSPDNDGFQDVLTINLQLTGTDNIIDVEIYDNRGRLVRELKDNFFAAAEVTFTWDGITDEGNKAPVGTYIVLVSITDIAGNQEQHKLVAVLAANL